MVNIILSTSICQKQLIFIAKLLHVIVNVLFWQSHCTFQCVSQQQHRLTSGSSVHILCNLLWHHRNDVKWIFRVASVTRSSEWEINLTRLIHKNEMFHSNLSKRGLFCLPTIDKYYFFSFIYQKSKTWHFKSNSIRLNSLFEPMNWNNFFLGSSMNKSICSKQFIACIGLNLPMYNVCGPRAQTAHDFRRHCIECQIHTAH